MMLLTEVLKANTSLKELNLEGEEDKGKEMKKTTKTNG